MVFLVGHAGGGSRSKFGLVWLRARLAQSTWGLCGGCCGRGALSLQLNLPILRSIVVMSHRLRLEDDSLGSGFAEECVPIRGLRIDLQRETFGVKIAELGIGG